MRGYRSKYEVLDQLEGEAHRLDAIPTDRRLDRASVLITLGRRRNPAARPNQ